MAGNGPGSLSTQVLNTAEGIPAEGVRVELWRMDPEPAQVIETVTNADGRTSAPLLSPDTFRAGRYELHFHLGAYFTARGIAPEPLFLDVVKVDVGLADGRGPYLVPLLCSPWSYTTYRGS
ncbi:hydroxyisourate hydrolase [Neoroseomonas soli]|uniref:5-hydroxyisourate hydrolase n=1 Tax=Neoroseomonas soli TaxID=1081025 RepID=A0A9X9WSI3_9PROT|nr:hydroxyisourate hydrolase [Neoroseomonas soli]MBR0670112.1 hydroxyisourate hydrolase [Neoroseomonas soli]